MNGDPHISVVMPVYNCEQHVEAALESILGQTWRDFELIVINDGSTDGTRHIVEAFAKRDSRVRVFNTTNRGVVAALNSGLEQARGALIARMDGDDIALDDRLEAQATMFANDPSLIASGGDVIKFGTASGLLSYPRTDADCKASLFFASCFAHPTVMMRADVLRRTGLRYEEGFECAEDYRLWSRLANHGKFSNLARPLIKYRIHETQIGTARRERQRISHLAIALHNWTEAGVEIDGPTLQRFLWPSLDGANDILHYVALYVRVISLTFALQPRRRMRFFRSASRPFMVNAGRRILRGRPVHA